MRKALAFLKRDLRVAVTYRVSFLESIAMLVIGLVSLDFVSRFINRGSPPDLDAYGGDYFAFALVGVSIALFAQSVTAIFPSVVRGAQVTGTLEVIVASRTTMPTFLLGSAIYGLGFSVLRLVSTLVIGAVVLGADLQFHQIVVVLVCFVLTVAAFAGVGILGAAFVFLFKQREPLTGGLITLSLLLSGVLYPTDVLPGWLEVVSVLLPLTHATDVLRATLLQNGGFESAADSLVPLAGFALLLPTGLLVFDRAVAHAKSDGTVGGY
jgi:ABC-2 type transport system permease protein